MPILPVVSFKSNPIGTGSLNNKFSCQIQSGAKEKSAINIGANPVKTTSNTPKLKTDFMDIFKKPDINEIKNLKTPSGNPRYNKEELKDIKGFIKKDKLDIQTVKYFSDTMLDPESMSEAYLFAKNTAEPAKELGIIKKHVKDYEKPYEKWPDSMKKDLSTKIKRIETVSTKQSAYKLENCMGTKSGIYGAGGKFYSESTVESGPFMLDGNDDENNSSCRSSDKTSSNRSSNGAGSLLDPANPCSPLNPINV